MARAKVGAPATPESTGCCGGVRAGFDGLLVERIGADRLAEYSSVPSLVEVESILQVKAVDGGFGGLALELVPVPNPYIKNYDSYGDTPADWPAKWDVTNWCFLLATAGGKPLGAACVVSRTPEIRMLEGRDDLGVLWDIRVAPGYKRHGIGKALFDASVQWCREQGFKMLKIETQNVNVPACRFYASQGARLGAIHRFAYADAAWSYPDVRDEVMLLWYYKL
jgi:GNAT superfamily N-acetyltransferase